MQRYHWRVVLQMVIFLVLVYFLRQFVGMVLGLIPALGGLLYRTTGGAVIPLLVFAGCALYMAWQMGLELDQVGLPLKPPSQWVPRLLGGLALGAAGLGLIWVVDRNLALGLPVLSVTDVLQLLLALVSAVVGAAATELIMRGVIARTLMLNLDGGLALGWAVLFETFTVLLSALGLQGTAYQGPAVLGALLATLAFSFFQVALYTRTRSLWLTIGTRAGLQFAAMVVFGVASGVPDFSIFGGVPVEAASVLLQESRGSTLLALFWLALACLLLFYPGVRRGKKGESGRSDRYLH